MAGQFVLIVGPSGAGKDTLLGAAADRLSDDRRFMFPRRMITRAPDAVTENHIAISPAEYDEMVADNDVTLAWRAHGLGYIIPRDVMRQVAVGKIAVCNGSRRIVAEAIAKYPRCAVILVTADHGVRARRLAARGRETIEGITARLAREGAPVPAGIEAIAIDNSGHLAESVDAFCQALLLLARRAEQENAPA